MESFDKKKNILKLLASNKKGCSVATIIEYLDYVNKVKYSEEEVNKVLDDLSASKKIGHGNGLWFPIGSMNK
jgi:hypothetical protein